MKEHAKQSKPKKRKLSWILILLLVLVAIFIDSNARMVVTSFELKYENLPQSFDGYKIVQLSDLHMADHGEKFYARIRALEPDILVLTGDFLNRKSPLSGENQAERLRPSLESLAAIAPCYFISGNHDWASGELKKLAVILEETGIRYLRNEFLPLEREGEQLLLIGAEDPNGPADMPRPNALVERAAVQYPEAFKIFLYHRNNLLKKYPDLPVDLVLCGHAHGGIVRLPFLGGVLGTENDLFPKYDAGLFNEGGYDMVLSRGLSRRIYEPRFLNNPELVSITLKAG